MPRIWIAGLIVLLCLAGCKSQTKEEMLQEGIKLSEQENYNGAVVYLKNALEKDPSYFEARYHLGIAYLRTGKFEQAVREFEKAGRQNPSLPELPLRLAEAYLGSDRAEKAVAEIRGFVQQHAPTADALDLLGRARAVQGDMSAARRHFEEALALDPHHEGAQTSLARVLVQEGRIGEARALLKRLAEADAKNRSALYLLARLESSSGNREAALAHYQRLAQLDADDSQALYMAGLTALSLGRIEEARQSAAALAAFGGNPPLGPQLKGVILYQEQNFEGAVIDLQKALKARQDPTALYFLGLSYHHLGNYELAVSQLQKVLDLNPGSVQARNMLAMTLLRQKRLEDAVREANMALRHDPASGLAHNILGSAFMAQGKFDQAVEAFERATELDPNLADAHLKKGIFSLSQGDFARGEKEMVRALTIAPEVLDTRLVLASHYLRQQNYASALETLRGGLQERKEDAVLYNVMAGAHFARNKPDEAVQALEAAKAADPGYFTPAFNLASWHLSQGNLEKARGEFQGVLAADPANVRALVGLGQLAEMEKDEDEALTFYRKAGETKELDGFLALAFYYGKKGKGEAFLGAIEEGLASHAGHPGLLELKGQVLLRSGKMDEAALLYRELEQQSPGRGYPTLVRILLHQGRRGEAEDLAREALRTRPDASYGYLLLSGIHEASGEAEEALRVLEEARSAVEDPRLEMQIGALYERAGQAERAETVYRKLIEETPRFHPAVFALGALQDTRGNKREALKLYERTLQLEKDYTPALNNLAYLHAENYGDPEEGLRLAARAYRNAPNRPEILDTFGYLLVRNGRAGEAVPLLEKAAGLLPGIPSVLYHLALAYTESGEKGMAVVSLERALEMGDFPEEGVSRELLSRLKG